MLGKAQLQSALELLEQVRGARKRDTLAKLTGLIAQGSPAAPMGEFREEGIGPDFAHVESWLAHPQRASGTRAVEDANHLAGPGSALPPVEDRPCDCFFLVDSCFGAHDVSAFKRHSVASQWNLPLGAMGLAEQRVCAKVVEQMEMRVGVGASCFNQTCRVYAPKYRQIHVGAFIHMPALAKMTEDPAAQTRPAKPSEMACALDLAYDDVRRAFLHFLNETAGRPFILAGHSQGTMYLVRLLQEEVEKHPMRRARFVHGYLAGFSVPSDIFQQSLHVIRPSESAADICSVSSWRTSALGHLSSKVLRVAAFYAGEGWRLTQNSAMLTNNPITWCQGPEEHASNPAEFGGARWPLPSNLADPRSDEGGLKPSLHGLSFGHRTRRSQEPLGARVASLVEVDCGPVTARIDSENELRVPHVPKGSLFNLLERDYLLYHDVDLALFHTNLQKNVALRVKTWQAACDHAPSAELPLHDSFPQMLRGGA